MSGLSHYEMLGVDRNATSQQIKSARRRLAVSLHPDKNPFGENLMKAVNQHLTSFPMKINAGNTIVSFVWVLGNLQDLHHHMITMMLRSID